MKIIGLTGGIGSGKSTVLQMFKSRGAAVFVADEVAKSLFTTDKTLQNAVIDHFGQEAYTNGQLNRAYLANLVFNDPEKLQLLNSLVHPRVREAFKNVASTTKADLLVYEAAILFESGSASLCDFVVLVTANREERIARVKARDQASDDQVIARMQHQTDSSKHFHKVNFIIRNENLLNTESQVDTIFELLLKSENK